MVRNVRLEPLSVLDEPEILELINVAMKPGEGRDRPEAEAESGDQIGIEEAAAAKAETQRSSVGMTDITL